MPLTNLLVTVGETEEEVVTTDTNSPAVCSWHPAQVQLIERIDCKEQMYGRYVRFAMLNVKQYLQVYEIEVIGH